jgi:hypothetical protein
MADVRQAFADLGWTVTILGPSGSSTNVDEDYLRIESEGGNFFASTVPLLRRA